MADAERQSDELTALAAILHDEEVIETDRDSGGRVRGQMIVAPHVREKLKLKVQHPEAGGDSAAASRSVQEHVVEYLPPFVLGFVLPADYPSQRPPDYTLCSQWATKAQLSKLCRELDSLWLESEFCEILYIWAEFLRSDSLGALGVDGELSLGLLSAAVSAAAASDAPPPIVDRRAVRDAANDVLAAAAVVEHDKRRRKERFDRTLFTCGVCLQERAGAACLQYGACTSHTFCRDCAKRHLQVRIKDGDVLGLSCPSGSCPATVHPAQVKELVPELYEKYERLLLQSTLDSMRDIEYCPRPHCQHAVVRDPDSNMASCASCNFVFCCLCRRAYHGLSPCNIGSASMLEIRRRLMNGSDADRQELEQRYGKKAVRTVLEESHALQWIDDNCRRCPHCDSSIEKNDGCNKMTCYKCHAYFCWLCGQLLPKVNPYSHYGGSSSCALFPGNWTNEGEGAGGGEQEADGFLFVGGAGVDDDDFGSGEDDATDDAED